MTDLVIDKLTVEFDGGEYPVRPLDSFSVTIGDGSLAVLLGPSGCGKTTLLSCLGGILTPTSGSIHHGGKDIAALRGDALSRYRQRDVGIVFQAFNLVPSLTAVENVMAPLRAAGVSAADARSRSEELLREVGLEERMQHKPSQMSGGQQQRVSLARALAHDPPLIIADEPTASLDYIQVEGVLRLLRELASPGRVVVVATHDDRLLPLADEIVEMVPKFRDEGVGVMVTELEAGELLFAQGSRGNRIYLIDEGEIDIVRELGGDRTEHLVTLGPGEHFGEMGPLFGIERSATARAKTAARVSGYTSEQFREHVGAARLTYLIRPELRN
ncbi:MAG: ATP-binding cassette domain-containing protein [Actinomycetota bacterium]